MSKNKYIETPDILMQLFKEYVIHERDNPMFKTEYVGREGQTKLTPLETPITFEGFECYLSEIEIIQDLGDYSKNDDGRYTAYAPIIKRIQKNCYVHNFKGAAVGLFNPNLIARKLGLTDKSDVNTNSSIKIINIDPLADDSTNNGT